MSNENKNVELKDVELQKVNGGVSYPLDVINLGDCFTNGFMYLISRDTYEVVNGNTIIECDFYNGSVSSDTFMYKQVIEVWNLFSSFTYNSELSNSSYVPHK